MACKTIYLVCFFTILFCAVSCNENENNSDTYITSSKSECFSSKNLFSCFKYKTARFIWSVATGQVQLLKKPIYSEYIHLVPIANNGADADFSEYRFESGASETSKVLSFLKRSFHMFLIKHGFKLSFENESGARLISDTDSTDEISEHRGKKKRKLALILPLIILVKMISLKIMLANAIVGIGVIQLLIVAGGSFLFYYLKHNKHCKIQGHPGHSHSHVVEPEPEPYSSYSGYHYNHYHDNPSYHSGYNNDWATNRAYSAFNNFMESTDSTSL